MIAKIAELATVCPNVGPTDSAENCDSGAPKRRSSAFLTAVTLSGWIFAVIWKALLPSSFVGDPLDLRVAVAQRRQRRADRCSRSRA